HPVVQTVINSLVECPEKALAATLSEFGTEWPFPRGDLFHYVPVLNRFDSIVAAICARSKITGTADLGKQMISPADKDVLLAILTFERLLLENCTNRNVYSSYEVSVTVSSAAPGLHLDNLMMAADVNVVEATLRLLLRPAQRLNAQRTVRAQFSVSKDTILTLAQTWIGGEHGPSFAQAVNQSSWQDREAAASSAMQFKFFRTAKADADKPAAASSLPALPNPPAGASAPGQSAVPVQRSRSSSNPALPARCAQGLSGGIKPAEGLTTITVAPQALRGRSLQEVFEDLVQQYQVPADSVALAAHYVPESKANSQVFIYNPDLINQIVELIHPDTGMPYVSGVSLKTRAVFDLRACPAAQLKPRFRQDIRTAALYAIDGVARYRGKMTEVLNALYASANHGPLLYAARMIVTELASDKTYSYDFLEAFFAVLTWIVGTQTGGNMVISAGIFAVLAPLLENERPHLLKVVTKAASLLDAVVYGFTNSFAHFAEARGVDMLVERIRSEVEESLAGAERQRQLLNAMTNSVGATEPEFPATSFVTAGLPVENFWLALRAVDELIRHHPSLKTHVYKSITDVLATIGAMGEREILEGDENLEAH
ncbi:MAG: hypothetical protein BJ554DRAFT_4695, partial [Olpidium bornovanus]